MKWVKSFSFTLDIWFCILLCSRWKLKNLKYCLLFSVSSIRNQWDWKGGRYQQEGAWTWFVLLACVCQSLVPNNNLTKTVCVWMYCWCLCVSKRGPCWESSETSHSKRLPFHDQGHCRGAWVKWWVWQQWSTIPSGNLYIVWQDVSDMKMALQYLKACLYFTPFLFLFPPL